MNNKPIKICFLSLSSYPLFNPNCKATFGGAEVQMYLLAKNIAEDQSFDVHFIVGDFDQKTLEVYKNIKVHKFLKKTTSIMRFLPTQKLLLIKLMAKINADVYIQRSASMGTGVMRLISKILNKSFIYMTAHDIDCNGEFEKQKNKITGMFFRYGIRNADVVITQSEKHKEMIKQHHKINSIVLKSGYEIPSIKEKQVKNTILWVARCEDWKQPEVFIELAKEHPQEKFVMIAPKSNNDPSYFEKIKKIAEKYKNIEFLDFIPFDKIDAYFEKAKIFVQTSKWEGFPNTFIQAAKNMTPILSFNVNPDNFIEENKCGLFANNDFATMKSHLNTMIKNSTLSKQLGQNGYNYVLTNHDINAIGEKYKAILKDLAYNKAKSKR